MSDDIEFDEAAKDIIDHTTMICDPQLVINIDRWMSKLMSDDRGPNELNYIKLLQYMMINRRIGLPFVRPPPRGRLLPLSKYLNPPMCKGTRSQEVGSWRTTTKHSKAAQTSDYVEEEAIESEDFGGEDELNEKHPNSPLNDDDDYELADDDAPLATDENNYAQAETAVAKTGEDAGGADNRDGHLAGGGERKTSHRKATGASKLCSLNKNPFVKLCNPCLDGLGLHLRKKPEPMDADYKELLGDCAVPTLTEAEAKTVSPELCRVLNNVNDATTLQEFYFQVCVYVTSLSSGWNVPKMIT